MSQITSFGLAGGGSAATSFVTNVGTATPLLGVIEIVGGSNIQTLAAGNQITVRLIDDVISNSFSTLNIPSSMRLEDNIITTQGSDPNVSLIINTQGTGGIRLQGIDAGFTNTDWFIGQNGIQTLDATPTVIVGLDVAEGQMVTMKAIINGFRVTFANSLGSEVLVTAFRPTAGNVTLTGLPVISTITNSTASITAAVDVGTQRVVISVVGVAAQVWNWATTYSFMYLETNA